MCYDVCFINKNLLDIWCPEKRVAIKALKVVIVAAIINCRIEQVYLKVIERKTHMSQWGFILSNKISTMTVGGFAKKSELSFR